MPPIIVLAAGAFAAGAIVHRLIKEVRRIKRGTRSRENGARH